MGRDTPLPDSIQAIADAVLYEGYILWPYRRSALKNQQRFSFGGVYPPAHTAVHPDDRSLAQTQVLIRGVASSRIEVRVRFLQVVRRHVLRLTDDGSVQEVDELIVDGERHLAWEEAIEREAEASLALAELGSEHLTQISIPAGQDGEPIAQAGRFDRRWRALQAVLGVSAQELSADLWRLSARIANTTTIGPGLPRREVLAQTLCSTHLLLSVAGAEFVSATDPPAELGSAAADCVNIGIWPVLVGDPQENSMMLASPIILEDHPRIAPESPGDLFDGGEIDQLLILSILSMTDEERAEMRAADPRAREILERTEALTPEQLMALNGTIREFGLAR